MGECFLFRKEKRSSISPFSSVFFSLKLCSVPEQT